MRSTTNQDGDKIQFKEIKDACGAGINEIYGLIREIIEKRPDALIDLSNNVLYGLKRKHEPNKYLVAEGQQKTIEEVMALKDGGDMQALFAAVRRTYKADDMDEWMVLSRLKLELMSAMFEYVITHEDNGAASKYVAYIRDHGSELERMFLDNMNRWSASSLAEKSRVIVESWIRTAAKIIDKSYLQEEEKEHQAERDHILKSMKKLKERVTSQDMLTGISKITTSDIFHRIKHDLDIPSEKLDQFVTHLLKQFDDTDFEMKLLAFTNTELFKMAVRLEDCLTCIDKIHAVADKNTDIYGYEKLIMVRELQALHASVLMRKQQLAAEMFQRLHYINPDVIPMFDNFECDAMIDAPVQQFNKLKHSLIKAKKREHGEFWPIEKGMFEAVMEAVKRREEEVDTLTPEQIFRYMIYISDSATDDQKMAVKNMLPAEMRYAPIGLTRAVMGDARDKKIFLTEQEFARFCRQAEFFHDADEKYSREKVLHKIVSLSKDKRDFDMMMDVCKINNDGCRDIFDRLFLSDVICTDSDRAYVILNIAIFIDSDPMMQAVLARMLEKFEPIEDCGLYEALKKLVHSENYFGNKLSAMFIHNCLSGSSSLNDFMETVKDAATLLKDDQFQNILFNNMDSSLIDALYQNCFEETYSDHSGVSLIEQITSQRRQQYLPSMNIAAKYLHDVMRLQEGRDNLLKDIIMFVVAVNDYASLVFTPVTSESPIEKVEELFNLLLSLSFTLRAQGFQDLSEKIVLDVMSSKSEEIMNDNIKVKMRVTMLRLLDFITRTKGISFDHASALSTAMFALYRKVKSGKNETSEIRQQLLSDLLTVSHILDVASKTPCDNNKIKKMLDELTQRNTATIGDELKVFSRCLQDCLPTNKKSIHAKSEPVSGSLGKSRDTAFSRRSKSLMKSETTNKSRNSNNNNNNNMK